MLCDIKAGKDVCLECATNEVDGDLRDRTALSGRGITDKSVEWPAERFFDVALVEHIQLVDRECVAEPKFIGLSSQICGLRPDVGCCKYAMPSPGESDGRALP